MHFSKTALSLVFLAGAVFAQLSLTQITYPPPRSTLTTGRNTVVQVHVEDYIQNVDVAVIVIGLAPCYGGTCYPASSFMGDILYQGPYTPQSGAEFANYTVKVPESFTTGPASLNVINLFMVGDEFEPVVNYVNENVTVVA